MQVTAVVTIFRNRLRPEAAGDYAKLAAEMNWVLPPFASSP